MAKDSRSPLDFLSTAQTDAEVGRRVLAAVERGYQVSADEVLQIAEEFGYSFTKSEFERAVKADLVSRLRTGEDSLDVVVGARKPKRPPMSSCARGCLSYTVSWHPPVDTKRA
jgi:hypothetical protein